MRQVITNECPLKGARKRKLTKPTGQAIFQLFAYVQVVVLECPNGQRQRKLGRSLTYEQQRVLRELGFRNFKKKDTESICIVLKKKTAKRPPFSGFAFFQSLCCQYCFGEPMRFEGMYSFSLLFSPFYFCVWL